MQPYFWSNTIWYVILGFFTVIELAYVLVKSDNRTLMFGLFLTVAGFLFMIEIQVLAVFKAYEYSPMIAAHISKIDDSIIGNVFSQFSIAATTLLVSFLKLKKYWYLICALIYGGIEELFLHLGIYQHHWYRTWMTIIGFTVLLWILNKVYKKVFNHPGRIFLYGCTFFAVYTLFVHLVAIPLRLFSIPPWKLLLADEWGSVAVNVAINYLILFGSVFFAYFARLAWKGHTAVIAILYAVYYLGYAIGYIVFESLLQVFVLATIHIFSMYLFLYVIDWLYGRIPAFYAKTR